MPRPSAALEWHFTLWGSKTLSKHSRNIGQTVEEYLECIRIFLRSTISRTYSILCKYSYLKIERFP